MNRYQSQFDQVRDLIEQEEYEAARLLLSQMDHPLAQKWLARVDQVDPIGAPERDRMRKLAREMFLTRWITQESWVSRGVGGALIGLAIYLWRVETVFGALTSQFAVMVFPWFVMGAGLLTLWNGRDPRWLRRQILRMNADELRKVSTILIPSMFLILLVTIQAGNSAQIFATMFILVIGILNLWRAGKTEQLKNLERLIGDQEV
ncbi:MAG: hypothetical protein MUF87_13840 [Anaerolineae bacterium]|jgi:hypothetical protein|nr:hypothetical protein [Anaerolineae bacterium]